MQPFWSRTRFALAAVTALTAVAALTPTSLVAQDDDDRDKDAVRTYSFSSFSRPRIGVTVGIKADKEKDRLGARIEDVTEDGPADKAGLKAGDIITRFNGVALAGLKADDDDASGPGQRLVTLARKLDEGDTVEVEYRRGSDNRKAKLVAEELPAFGMGNFKMRMPEMRGMMLPRTGPNEFFYDNSLGAGIRIFRGGMAGGLELAELNPELGEYFGAKEGVLVLKAGGDSTMPLRSGDVIVAIDGREPKSENQVRRILASYDEGETVKLDVLRKQKRVSLSWKVPEREDVKWRTPRAKRTPNPERS